jgi:D-ribulokinase
MATTPSKTLETFPNPQPDRDYIIEIETPEFTCLCPKTGQPDFATLTLEYVPDKLCVELKSLKLYVWSFRNEGHFHEKVTNMILNDLVQATQPRYMKLRAEFNVRGGVYTTVTSEFRKSGWTPAPPAPDHLPRSKQSAARVPVEAAPDATVVEIPPQNETPAARSDRFRLLKRRGSETATKSETPTTVAPPPPPKPVRDIYIGIDIGTTHCRAAAIDSKQKLLAQTESPLLASTRQARQITQDPSDWWKAASNCLKQLIPQIEVERIHRIAVSGTSALLLSDRNGQVVSPGIMHGDRRAEAEAERIAAVAGDHPAGHGPHTSLAKYLWLHNTKLKERAELVLHQADWISNRLAGRYGFSDFHTCLTLGFDPHAGAWPTWLGNVDIDAMLLPEVTAPGDVIGTVSAESAKLFGLPPDVEIVAGTTNGVAAFLSAGITEPGQGVTVLGHTLALGALTTRPVTSRKHGVFSHLLGRYWLAGGISNTGGNVLLQYFTVDQIREMDPLLDANHPTDLTYYPLPDIGERFPFNDPKKEPKLEPLPGDSTIFLQAMLEGIARIEAEGYSVLTKLGTPAVKAILTSGVGAQHAAWSRIREKAIGIKPKLAKHQNTAVGTALVASGILHKTYA